MEQWRPHSDDKRVLDYWFDSIDHDSVGSVGGAVVVNFLKPTGLSRDILRTIWNLADYDQKGTLNRLQFYKLIRLTSVCCKIPLPKGYPSQQLYLDTIHDTFPLPNLSVSKDVLNGTVNQSHQVNNNPAPIQPHNMSQIYPHNPNHPPHYQNMPSHYPQQPHFQYGAPAPMTTPAVAPMHGAPTGYNAMQSPPRPILPNQQYTSNTNFPVPNTGIPTSNPNPNLAPMGYPPGSVFPPGMPISYPMAPLPHHQQPPQQTPPPSYQYPMTSHAFPSVGGSAATHAVGNVVYPPPINQYPPQPSAVNMTSSQQYPPQQPHMMYQTPPPPTALSTSTHSASVHATISTTATNNNAFEDEFTEFESAPPTTAAPINNVNPSMSTSSHNVNTFGTINSSNTPAATTNYYPNLTSSTHSHISATATAMTGSHSQIHNNNNNNSGNDDDMGDFVSADSTHSSTVPAPYNNSNNNSVHNNSNSLEMNGSNHTPNFSNHASSKSISNTYNNNNNNNNATMSLNTFDVHSNANILTAHTNAHHTPMKDYSGVNPTITTNTNTYSYPPNTSFHNTNTTQSFPLSPLSSSSSTVLSNMNTINDGMKYLDELIEADLRVDQEQWDEFTDHNDATTANVNDNDNNNPTTTDSAAAIDNSNNYSNHNINNTNNDNNNNNATAQEEEDDFGDFEGSSKQHDYFSDVPTEPTTAPPSLFTTNTDIPTNYDPSFNPSFMNSTTRAIGTNDVMTERGIVDGGVGVLDIPSEPSNAPPSYVPGLPAYVPTNIPNITSNPIPESNHNIYSTTNENLNDPTNKAPVEEEDDFGEFGSFETPSFTTTITPVHTTVIDSISDDDDNNNNNNAITTEEDDDFGDFDSPIVSEPNVPNEISRPINNDNITHTETIDNNISSHMSSETMITTTATAPIIESTILPSSTVTTLPSFTKVNISNAFSFDDEDDIQDAELPPLPPLSSFTSSNSNNISGNNNSNKTSLFDLNELLQPKSDTNTATNTNNNSNNTSYHNTNANSYHNNNNNNNNVFPPAPLAATTVVDASISKVTVDDNDFGDFTEFGEFESSTHTTTANNTNTVPFPSNTNNNFNDMNNSNSSNNNVFGTTSFVATNQDFDLFNINNNGSTNNNNNTHDDNLSLFPAFPTFNENHSFDAFDTNSNHNNSNMVSNHNTNNNSNDEFDFFSTGTHATNINTATNTATATNIQARKVVHQSAPATANINLPPKLIELIALYKKNPEKVNFTSSDLLIITEVLLSMNLYNQAYLCYEYSLIQSNIDTFNEKKKLAVENDDLELAVSLKKQISEESKKLLPWNQLLPSWILMVENKQIDDSLIEIVDIIESISEVMADKCRIKYLSQLTNIHTLSLKEKLIFYVGAKRSIRLILMILTTHIQYPDYWKIILTYIEKMLMEGLEKLKYFEKLNIKEQNNVMSSAIMTTYLKGIVKLMEIGKLRFYKL